MKVIDLTEEHKKLYYACLEDWSDEMKEAGNNKECWCNKMKNKGLGVKIAFDDNEVRTGPPPSYKKIKKKIARQVKKL